MTLAAAVWVLLGDPFGPPCINAAFRSMSSVVQDVATGVLRLFICSSDQGSGR